MKLTLYHGTPLPEHVIRRDGLLPRTCLDILKDIKRIVGTDDLPEAFVDSFLLNCAAGNDPEDSPEAVAARDAVYAHGDIPLSDRKKDWMAEMKRLNRKYDSVVRDMKLMTVRPIYATGSANGAAGYAEFISKTGPGEAACLAIESLFWDRRFERWRRENLKGVKEPAVCEIGAPKVASFEIDSADLDEYCRRDFEMLLKENTPEEAAKFLNGSGCRIFRAILPDEILSVEPVK